MTAFYQKSLAQYDTGIIGAPNSEVPCLVLYSKLMSELILETAIHPGLFPGFYSISLYLPDWACSVFHGASALAEPEGHTTFRPQRKSWLCAIHDNLYLVYKTCTQYRKIKSVISHICDWNISHGVRQKNIIASWKMTFARTHHIC